MSLQTKLLILITSLTLVLALVLAAREIDGTRRSVHEEIRTAHHVAEQLMGHLANRPLKQAQKALERMGRIRAHDIVLLNAQGKPVYQSPESPYKAGRSVPGWFAAWVSPSFEDRVFHLPDGLLMLKADASRAVIDGWDDFLALAQWLAAGWALLILLCWQLVRRTLAPLGRVEAALRDMQQGRLNTRLPPLPGREAKLMSEAFNDMAGGLQEIIAAREEARRAQTRLAATQEMAVAVQKRVEEERRHIARELHDEMGQQLTAIRSLGMVIANRAGDANAGLQDAARLLVETTARLHDDLRRIVPRLRPVVLDRFGLRDALLELIADCRLQAPSTHFELRLPATLPLMDEAVSTALYRAAQEALTNVIKHADASHVGIAMRSDTAQVRLEIEDDGRGVPAPVARADGASPPPPGGFGLLGMRERIDALQGTLVLEPARQVAKVAHLMPAAQGHIRNALQSQMRPGLKVSIAIPLKRATS